jgi:hypothetical protein
VIDAGGSHLSRHQFAQQHKALLGNRRQQVGFVGNVPVSGGWLTPTRRATASGCRPPCRRAA